MSIAIAVSPASPKAKQQQAIISITGLAANEPTSYDAAKYPTERENRYHLKMVAPAGSTPQLDLTGPSFSCDHDGKRSALPIVFPVAGVWSIRLIKEFDASTAATQALTVAASS